eukprot:CAMPEP_0172297038 /NCGR_PEP_ID=MMETSP1058-20130122/213_1 /TAXON_ID=83371 /ORGANISM="Detonula confervacea, Strain CCMP 353" /LENGTH=269 /DNA_ID=CAMNT_0013006141 /DNA_START=40 /DNA_END=849 /DNA_ORIENTATION=+
MARGKGKRGGGRGGGKRFAAQSAEEIEQRNERLAVFDEARSKRRADAEKEKNGDDKDNDDDSVDSAQMDAEREAMAVGRRVAEMTVEGDDDGEWVEKEYKPKGTEGLIEVENSNRAPAKMTKLKDMGGEAAPMTRKEREEKEKEAKAAHYRKRHEAGLTEEYRHDMAKLNEVKARRAAAAAKVDAAKEAEDLAEAERKEAVDAANTRSGKDKKESKKKEKSGPPKLDKIAIKKMKPAALKEALKERKLEIQGNAKALQTRLLEYEADRK